MSNTTPAVPTDAELVSTLELALETARTELAELEPRRDALSARVSSLETTLAVFKGETPPPALKRRAKRPAVDDATRAERAAKQRERRAAKAAAQPTA